MAHVRRLHRVPCAGAVHPGADEHADGVRDRGGQAGDPRRVAERRHVPPPGVHHHVHHRRHLRRPPGGAVGGGAGPGGGVHRGGDRARGRGRARAGAEDLHGPHHGGDLHGDRRGDAVLPEAVGAAAAHALGRRRDDGRVLAEADGSVRHGLGLHHLPRAVDAGRGRPARRVGRAAGGANRGPRGHRAPGGLAAGGVVQDLLHGGLPHLRGGAGAPAAAARRDDRHGRVLRGRRLQAADERGAVLRRVGGGAGACGRRERAGEAAGGGEAADACARSPCRGPCSTSRRTWGR